MISSSTGSAAGPWSAGSTASFNITSIGASLTLLPPASPIRRRAAASPSSSASPRCARKFETSGSPAGSAISSTISASPPDRSSAAPASPP